VARYLLIVSRRDPGLHAYLEEFIHNREMIVIVDRRQGECRSAQAAAALPERERRRADRRRNPDINRRVAELGLAVVRIDGA
jgi:hypothetical protein